jgi:restriction endonuclease Mrr
VDRLLQRLRELDRDKFEGLIFQLLRERYPGADIKRVDGAGGDEGVDTFKGSRRCEGPLPFSPELLS